MVKKIDLKKIGYEDLLDVDDDEYIYLRFMSFNKHRNNIISPEKYVGIMGDDLYVFDEDMKLDLKIKLDSIILMFKYKSD